ncbi:MAG: MlaD family protein [Planctomycetota bacterium]|jgi:hypothetical protein
MARKTRNEVAVGVTTLVVLVLTIYIVVVLSDWSSLFAAQQKITVRLPYKVGLKGLGVGSPVHLGGVKIGQVTRAWISVPDATKASSDDIHVFFTMKIPRQYQLRGDCKLAPQQNILGDQAILSIEDLGREGELISDGQTVDLKLADNIMDAVRRELDSANPDGILALLKYEVNRDHSDSVVASLKNAAGQLEEGIPAVTDRLQQTLAKAESALSTAQSALQNLKRFGEDERIDRIISNIAEVSINLKLTSQEVRRAPWKLLYKPKQKEFRIQAVVDSAGAFAAGAERLDDAALRLQTLLAATDDETLVDKEEIKSMVSELEMSFERFQRAEEKFWEELE